LLPYLFLASALGLLGEWAVSVVAPRPAAVLLYVHVAVVSPILISTFWSHVNEQYDPFTAKRAVARIAGGGTAGGLIGGVLTWRASSIMSLRSAILALAVLNVLCVVGVLISRASGPLPVKVVRSTEPDPGALAPLRLLARAPFLRSLALLVAGGAAISSLLDYVFTAQAMVAYGKGEPLLAFFSLFGLAVALVSLAVQLALGRVATEKMGLVVNVGLLPGIILLGGAAGLAVPGLLSASALRGAELVYRNTLFRAAYELLYTPISPVLKRTTKALVDVGFDRLGTMLGAAVLAACVLTPEPQRLALVVVVALSLATGVLVRTLHRGYVEALAQGLRDNGEGDRSTLAGQRLTMDEERAREQLIAHTEALGMRPTEMGRARRALTRGPALSAAAAVLTSGSLPRVRKALQGWTSEMWPLAPFAVVLLRDDQLYPDARVALLTLGSQITGLLTDALTDLEMDVTVRRRIPRVLCECGTQVAADSLMRGVTDPRFEVRYACGRALLRLTEGRSDIVLPEAAVVAAVLHEAKAQPAPRQEDDTEATDDDLPTRTLVDVIVRERVARNLEHMFTLLALVLEREPLRLCLRALHHKDVRHRGTALEYLQTVLPSDVREALWPLLGDVATPLPALRPAGEILKELALS
jgi:hypothetical protein